MRVSEINRGDLVTIRVQGHTVVDYVVDQATNYGGFGWSPDDCWYIECHDPVSGNPCYWKQDVDGGELLGVKEGKHDS
jgi:hypothetical protein